MKRKRTKDGNLSLERKYSWRSILWATLDRVQRTTHLKINRSPWNNKKLHKTLLPMVLRFQKIKKVRNCSERKVKARVLFSLKRLQKIIIKLKQRVVRWLRHRSNRTRIICLQMIKENQPQIQMNLHQSSYRCHIYIHLINSHFRKNGRSLMTK